MFGQNSRGRRAPMSYGPTDLGAWTQMVITCTWDKAPKWLSRPRQEIADYTKRQALQHKVDSENKSVRNRARRSLRRAVRYNIAVDGIGIRAPNPILIHKAQHAVASALRGASEGFLQGGLQKHTTLRPLLEAAEKIASGIMPSHQMEVPGEPDLWGMRPPNLAIHVVFDQAEGSVTLVRTGLGYPLTSDQAMLLLRGVLLDLTRRFPPGESYRVR